MKRPFAISFLVIATLPDGATAQQAPVPSGQGATLLTVEDQFRIAQVDAPQLNPDGGIVPQHKRLT